MHGVQVPFPKLVSNFRQLGTRNQPGEAIDSGVVGGGNLNVCGGGSAGTGDFTGNFALGLSGRMEDAQLVIAGTGFIGLDGVHRVKLNQVWK